jgi:hypothetical protein
MVDCSILEEWDSMSLDERMDALEEVINDSLESWGFDPVNVDTNNTDNTVPGEYDPNTGIHLNPNSIDGSDGFLDGFEEAAAVALHEAVHHLQHELGWDSLELEAFQLGGEAALEILEGCQSSPDSVPANIPDYPFQSG